MTWYTTYDTADGNRLISVGTVLYDPLPDGYAVVEAPEEYPVGCWEWQPEPPTYVSVPCPPPPDPNDALMLESAQALDQVTMTLAVDPTPATTVVYQVRRIETAWGHAIEAEGLRGYRVTAQLALRIFDPWDGSIPFEELPDGRIVATVVGVGSPDPLYPWEYGIWVQGIPLDHQTLSGPGPEEWLATQLIIDGTAVAGGSVPSTAGAPPA